MINFFRSIRRKLAMDNQFLKYSRYAIGEIVLIMLGIFLALQLQNWNENRKKDEAFKLSMESLFNTLNSDVETYKGIIEGLRNRITSIDWALNNPDSLKGPGSPYILHAMGISKTSIFTNTADHEEKLVYNSEDPEQINLSRRLAFYVYAVASFESMIDDRINRLIQELNIPYPRIEVDKANEGWITNDSTYYSKEQIERAQKLMSSERFQSELKSIRSMVIWESYGINVFLSDALSLSRAIKKYHPDVRLIYEDVGIIGSSINGYDDTGGISTPMIQSLKNQDLWEVELFLKKGTVKFRCRDSWVQNWGGSEFPKGKAISFGGNIPVTEEGTYHISLDLKEGSYYFKKID